MTLPAAGSTISFSQIQTEFGGTNPVSISEYYRNNTEFSTTTINSDRMGKPDGTNWALIPQSGAVSISNFRYATAFNGSPQVEYYSAPASPLGTLYESSFRRKGLRTIRIYAVSAGGGGGGGSSRYYAWWPYGGGGGGASGEIRYTDITVNPDTSLTVYVGAGGAGGGARDGPYSEGSDGGTGGYSGVVVNGNWAVLAYGGNGGPRSGYGAGGSGVQAVGVGTIAYSSTAGTAPTYYTYTYPDGKGTATGYVQNPGGQGGWGRYTSTVPASTWRQWYFSETNIGGLGGTGTAGPGAAAYATPGLYMGGGGGGGGVNVIDNNLSFNGAAGYSGAVFILY